MALPKKSGTIIRKVLEQFDPEGAWRPCLENINIQRGSVEEYGDLAARILAVYPEDEDQERLCASMQKTNGLPKRFVRHFGDDTPEPGLSSDIVTITERLARLEAMLNPLAKEKEERAEVLAESGKLLKATNLRLDQLPPAEPTPAPRSVVEPAPKRSLKQRLGGGY